MNDGFHSHFVMHPICLSIVDVALKLRVDGLILIILLGEE